MEKFAIDNEYYKFCIRNLRSHIRSLSEKDHRGHMERDEDNGFSIFSGAFILSKCWCISQEAVLNDLMEVDAEFCQKIAKETESY